jgi:hypothetical protein
MFIDVLQYAEEKAPRGVHGNKNPFLSIWLRFPLRCTGLSGQVARSVPRSGTRPSPTLLSGQGNKHPKTKEERPCNGDAHTDLVSRPLFFSPLFIMIVTSTETHPGRHRSLTINSHLWFQIWRLISNDNDRAHWTRTHRRPRLKKRLIKKLKKLN